MLPRSHFADIVICLIQLCRNWFSLTLNISEGDIVNTSIMQDKRWKVILLLDESKARLMKNNGDLHIIRKNSHDHLTAWKTRQNHSRSQTC